MKKVFILALRMIIFNFILVSCSDEKSSTEPGISEASMFPDVNLEQIVREVIGKPIGEIFPNDVDTITVFEAECSEIADLTGMEYLVSLEEAYLGYHENYSFISNYISDLSPLSNLRGLTKLELSTNQIIDITLLSNLDSLEILHLGYNQITDISSLSCLLNLEFLNLSNNQIANIYPLVQNLGLATGDMIFLFDNPLDTTSINTYIPELESRGVILYY